jgi:hypothetical protein
MFCTLAFCFRLPDIPAALQPCSALWLADIDAPVDMVFVQPECLIRVQLPLSQRCIDRRLVTIGANALRVKLRVVDRGLRHISEIIVRLKRYV